MYIVPQSVDFVICWCIYMFLYVYNESSWWWAQYCSKHVEEVENNEQMVH